MVGIDKVGIKSQGDGEVAQPLRTLAALSEDSSLFL